MGREISEKHVPFRVSENVRVYVREHEGISGYSSMGMPVRVRRRPSRPKRYNQQLGALKAITIPVMLIALLGLYSGFLSTSGGQLAVGNSYAASVLSDSATYGKHYSHANLSDKEMSTRKNIILQPDFPPLDDPVVNWVELYKREAKRLLVACEKFPFRI